MRKIARLFPVFFVVWYAKKHMQTIEINGIKYVRPFDDILIKHSSTGIYQIDLTAADTNGDIITY